MNPEQMKYEKLWNEFEAYRLISPGEVLAHTFVQMAGIRPHHTVIDFGTGTGRGAAEIFQRTGATVEALDFVDGCMDPDVKALLCDSFTFKQTDLSEPLKREVPADFGYCTDVMEHVPPEQVDAVLANVVSSARRVFFCISTVPDKMGALIGEQLHLTVQPAAWWRDKLTELLKCKIMWEHVAENAVMFYLTAWATFDDFEHKVVLNTAQEELKRNIHANLDMQLQEVRPYEVQPNVTVTLLCGGPSLTDFEGKFAKGPLVTVNGAYNWAIERGMKPGLQIIVDARAFNARFVEPVLPDCKYAISSQCDPEILRRLPRDQVLLWHGAGQEVLEMIGEYDREHNIQREYYPVNGGSTVTLRALPLLAMLGFRKVNVYGFDSCLRQVGPMEWAHHAYKQAENNGDRIVPISVDGKHFLCNGWMVKQAQEFQELCRHILIPVGMELAVHGDGLIAAILKAAAAAHKE